MIKILTFLYALVLFLSLFIFSIAAQNLMKCNTDDECPKFDDKFPLSFKCINDGCRMVINDKYKHKTVQKLL
ncbi:Nodule Cysteine-Rich (NCR) secreted peptide [Medicago truncatula]|uniref:Nodule Cysteine-Rich (NCR) secreted peptide n=1 Tax=Medicago truncatula TaxID=3880 RepID=G7K8Y9_MEDTR|nr:Nodule Cysteine-Rich (NCR) secreted peptide [Medicago truncatula]